MLSVYEIEMVYKWMKQYPAVNEWGWKDGPLSQKEALLNPSYG